VVWTMPQHQSTSSKLSSVTATGILWSMYITLLMIVERVTPDGAFFDWPGTNYRSDSGLFTGHLTMLDWCILPWLHHMYIGKHCSSYIGLFLLSPLDGTVNSAPCQGSQPPWHAKDRFPDVQKRVGSLGAVWET
jgi:hypothetical protein